MTNEQLAFAPAGRLFFGDNLEVMRRHVADDSVDLVYLDPPFNSNRSYNVLFEHRDGTKAAGQVKAFDDTWTWSLEAARVYKEVVESGGQTSRVLRALRDLLDTSDMLAYLTMMAPRLVEMHRSLKQTGWLFLHCDPTASHYLKLLLDAIFGPTRFRAEIIWKRTSAHSDTAQGRQGFGRVHDVLLAYSKGDRWTWNPQYTPYDASYIEKKYRYIEEGTGRRYRKSDLTAAKPGGDTLYEWKGRAPYKGRYWAYSRENMEAFDREGRLSYTRTGTPELKHYLDEMPGVPLQDLWTDIGPIAPRAAERLGYPTQKPVALLERIIAATTNPQDTVLDPFCGCGTTIDAAHQLDRRWIGIDVTKIAIDVIRDRLETNHGNLDYVLRGEPGTIDEAVALAELDKHEFQNWVCRRLGVPAAEKKGADRGIDGRFVGVYEDGSDWDGILSVKGGRIKAQDVRDLHGTVEREQATFGVLVSLHPFTKAMRRDAADVGFTDEGIPRLQLITVQDLFSGTSIQVPSKARGVRRLRAV